MKCFISISNNRLITVCFLCFGWFFSFGQVELEWQSCFGGYNNETPNSICETLDGGYIASGYTYSENLTNFHGERDALIVKYDSTGFVEWYKCFGGSQYDIIYSILSLEDGGYIFTGSTNSNDGDVSENIGWYDIWVVKINSEGNIIWQKCIGGTALDDVRKIISKENGNFLLVGLTASNNNNVSGNHGGLDLWLVEIDPSGNILWQKCYGGTLDDMGYSISQTEDNGFIIAGLTNSTDGDISYNHGSADIWVIKINEVGGIEWQKCFGGTDYEDFSEIFQTNNGGYLVSGSTRSTNGDINYNHGNTDIFLLQLDSIGNVQWKKCYGGPLWDYSGPVHQTNDGNYLLTCYTNSNSGDVFGNHSNTNDFWVVNIDPTGDLVWQKCFGGTNSEQLFSSILKSDGSIILAGGTSSNDGDVFGYIGNGDCWLVKLNTLKIKGSVYYDWVNPNCIMDISEYGIRNQNILISPGDYLVHTNLSGTYYLESLPVGEYTVTIDTTGSLWTSTCPFVQSFSVTNVDEITQAPIFGITFTNTCTNPNISVFMPEINPGVSDQIIYFLAQNQIEATSVLNDPFVIVELPPQIMLEMASIPFIDLGTNVYKFDIEDLSPGENKLFFINAIVDTSAIMQQTLCVKANLFPVDSCLFEFDTIPDINPYSQNSVTPCTLPWDNSNIEIEGWCNNDSIFFSVINTGSLGIGDMVCYSEIRVFIDENLFFLDSIQLIGQESKFFPFSADGRTWRMEVDQHPMHPGNSHPCSTVEICGDQDNWTPGLVNIFPQDDEDLFVDIYCGEVTGSYDPNDKTGYPLGISSNHYVNPNNQLEYIIRFQNTGNDTAFFVVLRDTLDTDLNIFTVAPGVSSHEYSFDICDSRVLEWTFGDIELPDSATNEPDSKGYVKFTVDQNPNLPEGTEITNKVGIFFDLNPPVLTNTTSHLINTESYSLSWDEELIINGETCDQFVYNGIKYNHTGTYFQIIEGAVNDTLVTINVTVYPDLNLIVNDPEIQASDGADNYQWVDCQDDFSLISGETESVFTASENGSYAVIVSENGCVDTSECILINSVFIIENTFQNQLSIFPNPTNGKVTIDMGAVYGEIEVAIADLTGKIIDVNKFDNDQILELEITQPAGVYVFTIKSGSERAVVRILKK